MAYEFKEYRNSEGKTFKAMPCVGDALEAAKAIAKHFGHDSADSAECIAESIEYAFAAADGSVVALNSHGDAFQVIPCVQLAYHGVVEA